MKFQPLVELCFQAQTCFCKHASGNVSIQSRIYKLDLEKDSIWHLRFVLQNVHLKLFVNCLDQSMGEFWERIHKATQVLFWPKLKC